MLTHYKAIESVKMGFKCVKMWGGKWTLIDPVGEKKDRLEVYTSLPELDKKIRVWPQAHLQFQY